MGGGAGGGGVQRERNVHLRSIFRFLKGFTYKKGGEICAPSPLKKRKNGTAEFREQGATETGKQENREDKSLQEAATALGPEKTNKKKSWKIKYHTRPKKSTNCYRQTNIRTRSNFLKKERKHNVVVEIK